MGASLVHNDRLLFEFLILEGALGAACAGTMILKKRESYLKVFDGFRPEKIARYSARDAKWLLDDAGIVRNRLKIAAAMENAEGCPWRFAKNLGIFLCLPMVVCRWKTNPESMAYAWPTCPRAQPNPMRLARDLQRRGFKFVGSTICYALMQAKIWQASNQPIS